MSEASRGASLIAVICALIFGAAIQPTPNTPSPQESFDACMEENFGDMAYTDAYCARTGHGFD